MASSGSYTKNLKGVAGVHLVVAELSMRGYVALPTTRNLKSVDIVAFDEGLSRFAFIQVKSTDRPRDGWPVHTVKEEEGWKDDVGRALAKGAQFFFVFVALPSAAQPQPLYYVVPASDVAEMVTDDLEGWVRAKPGRKVPNQLLAWGYGGLRPEVTKKYRDAWNLLAMDA